MGGITILVGDCRDRLKELPDGSVHCVVTSPPYFGLRDYGTGTWEGGDPDCAHVRDKGNARSTLDGTCTSQHWVFKEACGRCGATRIDRQLGLEQTPDEFIAVMVDVFREVRRVLRDDGILWLNIGDSYAGSWGEQGKRDTPGEISRNSIRNHPKRARTGAVSGFGCKAKELIGIPWRLALALSADGWFLRQDVIWSKPNPMPESVRDRCTKAHEYLFLLSKSDRYFFDQDAISEPIAAASVARLAQDVDAQSGSAKVPGKTNGPMKAVARSGGECATRNKRSVWTVPTVPFDLERCTACCTTYWRADHQRLPREKVMDGATVIETRVFCTCGRNDAWLSHFATFPPNLIEPCILAGCPEGGRVLDPFFGAGTTGLVADRLHRTAIGCELNPHYVAMAEFRLKGDGGMFAQVQAA